MKRSIFLISFLSMYNSGLKSLTPPAIFVSNPLVSNRVRSPIPDFPSQTFFHAVSTPIPMGITNPIPVTTTLLLKTSSLLQSVLSEDLHPVRNNAPLEFLTGFTGSHGLGYIQWPP